MSKTACAGEEPQMKRILRTREAAAYIGLAAATLEKRRVAGEGPRFIRLGGRSIGYAIEDLDEWLDRQRNDTAVEGNRVESD